MLASKGLSANERTTVDLAIAFPSHHHPKNSHHTYVEYKSKYLRLRNSIDQKLKY
jgi:hypothetical protein